MKKIKMFFQILILFSAGALLVRYLDSKYEVPLEISFGAFLALIVAPLAWSVSSSWKAVISRTSDGELRNFVFKKKSFWESCSKNYRLGKGSKALSVDSQSILPGGQRATGKAIRLTSPLEQEHFDIPLTFSPQSAKQKIDEINQFLASDSGDELKVTEGGEGFVGPLAVLFVAACSIVSVSL